MKERRSRQRRLPGRRPTRNRSEFRWRARKQALSHAWVGRDHKCRIWADGPATAWVDLKLDSLKLDSLRQHAETEYLLFLLLGSVSCASTQARHSLSAAFAAIHPNHQASRLRIARRPRLSLILFFTRPGLDRLFRSRGALGTVRGDYYRRRRRSSNASRSRNEPVRRPWLLVNHGATKDL